MASDVINPPCARASNERILDVLSIYPPDQKSRSIKTYSSVTLSIPDCPIREISTMLFFDKSLQERQRLLRRLSEFLSNHWIKLDDKSF